MLLQTEHALKMELHLLSKGRMYVQSYQEPTW